MKNTTQISNSASHGASTRLGRRLTALAVAQNLNSQTLPALAASGDVYSIHTDHLDTPRAVTNQQNQVVWQNTPLTEPFGSSAPEEDPGDTGTPFTFNLRFPGQYYDQETGTHYNYYRDHYFPGLGRYGQSDPIRLGGGINTYVYVGGNSLSYFDSFGLVVQGTWIRPPRLNIQDLGVRFHEFFPPEMSDLGYLKFIRLHGYFSGYINIDVRCTDEDECQEWEIHNKVPLAYQKMIDLGPNIYAMAGGLAWSLPVGVSINIVILGYALLDAEYRFLSEVNQKAGPLISTLAQDGPTLICIGSSLF